MNAKRPAGFPKKLREGHAEVTIYWQANATRRKNPETGKWDVATGATHDEYVLAYYQGAREVIDPATGQKRILPKLIRKKYGDYADAEREARFVLTKLANAEGEVLKLTGLDRLAYVEAMQELAKLDSGIKLSTAITDYTRAMERLPKGIALHSVIDFYLSRHPAGLPKKTIAEVVEELISQKENARRSEVYIKDLRLRLGSFAAAFKLPIASLTGKQIQDWLDGLKVAPRTFNNYRRLIITLCQFAVRRGYLPKDFSETSSVERAQAEDGEIEVFTPNEIKLLFGAVRQEMVPYLAIGAFAGLRSAEIDRLDWSEVHLTGPEKFIEVKASKAKTASRRIVPITDNLAAWLASYVKESGEVAPFARADKQLFLYLAAKSGVKWKRNGLRHSFISYRLAIIKNVHQVSLEAGNSPQMVFAHYRQLVTETAAKEWFAVIPPSMPNIIPMAAPAANFAQNANCSEATQQPAKEGDQQNKPDNAINQ